MGYSKESTEIAIFRPDNVMMLFWIIPVTKIGCRKILSENRKFNVLHKQATTALPSQLKKIMCFFIMSSKVYPGVSTNNHNTTTNTHNTTTQQLICTTQHK